MYEVRFTGFKTKQEALEFAAWYEGAGEQDSDPWMEANVGRTAYVDRIEEDFTQPHVTFVRIK